MSSVEAVVKSAEAGAEKSESVWKKWWQELQKDPGGRAELRRCGTVAEAAFCAPFHFLRRLKGNPTREIDLNKLALISVVLSHVKEDSGVLSLGAQMGEPSGDKALVSDTRFRQLLRAEESDFDERLAELVRVVHQLGQRASIDRLGEDLWWWNDRTRRRWALDYYERAPKQKNRD